MAEPDERQDAELSVTMVGDLASALKLVSAQRRTGGDDNSEVICLVEEAVSDWLDREIHGPPPTSEESEAADSSTEDLPAIEFPIVEISSQQDQAVFDPAVGTVIVETPATVVPDLGSGEVDSSVVGSSIADSSIPDSRNVNDRSSWPISGRAILLVALIATLLGFASWGVSRYTKEPVQEFVQAPPPGITTGVLIVDAQPWAEVERIWNHAGIEVSLPDDRFTPLRLELPPGAYNVSLVRPDSPVTETCAVPVSASETVRCMPRQADFDITMLFKETGWYQ